MMGFRFYLLIALAVSCHGLPKTADAVVPEHQTMLLQLTAAFTKMTPTAFISAISSSGGSEADCRTFADETIKGIKATITAQQGVVGQVSDGSKCAAMGQDEVQAEKAKVAAAAKAVEAAKADVVSKEGSKHAACTADVNLGTISLAALEVNSCFDYSNVQGYTTVKAACASATSALAAANQAVITAKTKATGADTALAGAVKEASRLKSACLCSAQKAQKVAWAAVSTATDAHAADWKQAHEVICALDSASTCNVPTCPTVTQPTLAAGVANAPCENKYTCAQSYYCEHGKKGPWERSSAASSRANYPETDVVEACNADPKCTGYTYNADHTGSNLYTCYQTTYPGTGHQTGAYHGTLKLCQLARYQAAN